MAEIVMADPSARRRSPQFDRQSASLVKWEAPLYKTRLYKAMLPDAGVQIRSRKLDRDRRMLSPIT